MNNEFFLNLLQISLVTSIISSQMIQKIKQIFCANRVVNHIISAGLSFLVGFLYTISFYNSYNIVYAIWIGLFTLIGAEGMYKTFKGLFGLKSINN